MSIKMEYIGYLAAFLTTISFAPQALKTIRTKSTESLSLGMYLVITIGLICWLVYGIHLQNLPIMLANAISLAFTGTILFLKIKHG